MTGRHPIGALVAAVALALGGAACSKDPDVLVGYEVDPAPAVGSLTLTDTSTGTDVPLRAAASGELLVVFLGFTNCPDACPLALADVRSALALLGDEAGRIDVAMVTVDPQRDTPDVLTDYVKRFVPDGTGLRTEDDGRLREVVDAFGATYETDHGHDGEAVEVGHTDYTYVVDDTGDVVLTWTAEMTSDDLVNDLRILLSRSEV